MQAFPWSLSEIESHEGRGELLDGRMVRASEAAIEALEPSIRAWAWLGLEQAHRRARTLAESGQARSAGPLLGVPYAVKDIFDTAGIPTEWGTETQRGRVPRKDCALVSRLHSLGAVLLGKTHTTAYAYFDAAPTRNPHHLGHTPGGSSSGSAAAVAAGMVPLAVGSQTQGSVLRPASFCGICGFKPTYALLPLAGVMPFAPDLDHAGLFARSASDIRVAWSALGYESAAEPAEAVTAIDWPPGEPVDPEMAAAFRSALRRLSEAGLRVNHCARPGFLDALPDAIRQVMTFEAAGEHGDRYREFGHRMGRKLSELLGEGLRMDATAYHRGLDLLHAARVAFGEWAGTDTVIATPAAPGAAPAGLESTGDPRCNAPFTALGIPAVSIPMPVGAGGLPLGLQLVAAKHQDSRLLATAALCERLLETAA